MARIVRPCPCLVQGAGVYLACSLARPSPTTRKPRRWLEDGQAQINAALALVESHARIEASARAAEAEAERLRGLVYENERLRNQVEAAEHECARLRETVAALHQDGEREAREREEIAASLTDFLNGVLARLRAQRGLTS